MVDDLHTVKKYLRTEHKGEAEDKVADKAKDRVLTDLARSIRNNKGLPSGPCQLCFTKSERLAPVQIKISMPEAKRIIARVGGLRIQQVKNEEFYSDLSFGKAWVSVLCNPFVCQKCHLKIGKKHQRMMPKLVKWRQDDRALREKILANKFGIG